jgi:arylformamidase
VIDISAGVGEELPIWPTSLGWDISRTRDVLRGDPVTESYLKMDVHCGTHVDAPLHHLAEGTGVDGLDPAAFLGPVLVVDATGHAEIPEHIAAGIPAVERVLFRTDNSVRRLMRSSVFAEDFVGISLAAASALARRGDLLLVGNDYLSVQAWSADDEVHRVLLRRRIALLEGLDLADVQPGWYELCALPILLRGAEAAPVRAVLRRTTSDGNGPT